MDERRHRVSFSRFAQEQARPEYRRTLGRLNQLWNDWNQEFFSGKMVVPYILFTEPKFSGALGQYSPITSIGAKAEIKIRPSLVWGGHPLLRGGKKFDRGRFLFVADVLLHEMVHQWQHEVIGDMETTQAGHGPLFREKCNEIGEVLKLPKIRAGKARGKDKDLPSCASWPHNVRAANYYRGAVITRDNLTPLGRLCRAARRLAEAPEDVTIAAELIAAAINYGKAKADPRQAHS